MGKSDSRFTSVSQNWLCNCSFAAFVLNGLLKMKTGRICFIFMALLLAKSVLRKNHRSIQVQQRQVEPSLTDPRV